MTPSERYTTYRGNRLTDNELLLFDERFGGLDAALVIQAIDAAADGSGFVSLDSVSAQIAKLRPDTGRLPHETARGWVAPTDKCRMCSGSGFLAAIHFHGPYREPILRMSEPCPDCQRGADAAFALKAPRRAKASLPYYREVVTTVLPNGEPLGDLGYVWGIDRKCLELWREWKAEQNRAAELRAEMAYASALIRANENGATA